jgi:hypothetical protein
MATTSPQFDLKGHLLSLRGLTPKSTKMARFFDANHILIAERPVTAAECWNAGASCWSNFMLADGPTARALGAASVCFISEGCECERSAHHQRPLNQPVQEMK